LGNGFVIYEHENKALCLGAAHSFEAVARDQRRRTAQPAPGFPAEFLPAGPRLLKTDGIFAVVVGASAVNCVVRHICYIDNYDVALFSIEAENEHRFPGRIGIDLSMPTLGEQLSVLGIISEFQGRTEGSAAVRSRFELRCGLVTAVSDVGKNRLGQNSERIERCSDSTEYRQERRAANCVRLRFDRRVGTGSVSEFSGAGSIDWCNVVAGAGASTARFSRWRDARQSLSC
jgi:hypothetical protein